MGCDYIQSRVRFKGRLLQMPVCNRGGGPHLSCGAVVTVIKGKPLFLFEDSEEWNRLNELIRRNRGVKSNIQDYENSC